MKKLSKSKKIEKKIEQKNCQYWINWHQNEK